MSDLVSLAVQHKHQHPSESYDKGAARFQSEKTTLNDHFKGTHSSPGINAPLALSIDQERIWLKQIASHADGGP